MEEKLRQYFYSSSVIPYSTLPLKHMRFSLVLILIQVKYPHTSCTQSQLVFLAVIQMAFFTQLLLLHYLICFTPRVVTKPTLSEKSPIFYYKEMVDVFKKDDWTDFR